MSQPLRILIVEDEADYQKILKRKCGEAWSGLEVVCVRTAQLALSAVSAGPAFDLVLLDLRIPFERGRAAVENGVSVITRLRGPEFNRSKEELPIVVITAEDTAKAAMAAMKAGANDLVTKDDTKQIVETIRRELGARVAPTTPPPPVSLANKAPAEPSTPAAAGSPLTMISTTRSGSTVLPVPPLVPWVPTSLAEVQIVMEGTLLKKTARAIVCGVSCYVQEVQFRLLGQLRLHALKGQDYPLEKFRVRRSDESPRDYNPVSRLRTQLEKKGLLPRELAQAVVATAGHGEYRLALPLENLFVVPSTMDSAFRSFLLDAERPVSS